MHAYGNVLGEVVCESLSFWHPLTGCDTVSLFAGKGKGQRGKLGTVFQSLHHTLLGIARLKNLV